MLVFVYVIFLNFASYAAQSFVLNPDEEVLLRMHGGVIMRLAEEGCMDDDHDSSEMDLKQSKKPWIKGCVSVSALMIVIVSVFLFFLNIVNHC